MRMRILRVGVVGLLSACAATHGDDAATSADLYDAAPSPDVGVEPLVDAPPPAPDADRCGTLLTACVVDAGCDEGQTCLTVTEVDAGAPSICVPRSRGSCSWGGPCPDPRDECHESVLMTDGGPCFDPREFLCLCQRSPEFRDVFYDCPR